MRIINMKETGKNIKRLMKESNVSVKELTKILGFSTQTSVYKWFRGEALPALDNLIILTDVLNCGVDAILVTEEA